LEILINYSYGFQGSLGRFRVLSCDETDRVTYASYFVFSQQMLISCYDSKSVGSRNIIVGKYSQTPWNPVSF
jgi:hypothetical protein